MLWALTWNGSKVVGPPSVVVIGCGGVLVVASTFPAYTPVPSAAARSAQSHLDFISPLCAGCGSADGGRSARQVVLRRVRVWDSASAPPRPTIESAMPPAAPMPASPQSKPLL